jgi:molybdate transport system substrate-binding protein
MLDSLRGLASVIGASVARCAGVTLLLACLAACSRKAEEASGSAGPLRLAVASNFAGTAEQLKAAFMKAHPGTQVEISAGATGKLYAQIKNGAPFHVFLSADAERPRQLETEGLGVKGTRALYALGRLVLYGPAVRHPDDGSVDLRAGDFKHLSIANPESAPYGVAAQQVLEKLGLLRALSPRITRGENITQAFQFVESGGAEIGFVALSSLGAHPKHPFWRIPQNFYAPIEQEAILLKPGADQPRAREFVEFLKTPEARELIQHAGYATE